MMAYVLSYHDFWSYHEYWYIYHTLYILCNMYGRSNIFCKLSLRKFAFIFRQCVLLTVIVSPLTKTYHCMRDVL